MCVVFTGVVLTTVARPFASWAARTAPAPPGAAAAVVEAAAPEDAAPAAVLEPDVEVP